MLATYSMPPSLFVREEEYILGRLYSASRHLEAGHPAHQYIDNSGNVTNLTEIWGNLSGIGIFFAYKSAIREIHNRWRASDQSVGVQDHQAIPQYREFVRNNATSALAFVVHRDQLTLSRPLPHREEAFYKPPCGLTAAEFFMVVIYEIAIHMKNQMFQLRNGYQFYWPALTSEVISSIYRTTHTETWERWVDNDLTIRVYGDLYRAIGRQMRTTTITAMEKRVLDDGRIDMSASPHQQVMQPSRGSRADSPVYRMDHYDPTDDMSL